MTSINIHPCRAVLQMTSTASSQYIYPATLHQYTHITHCLVLQLSSTLIVIPVALHSYSCLCSRLPSLQQLQLVPTNSRPVALRCVAVEHRSPTSCARRCASEGGSAPRCAALCTALQPRSKKKSPSCMRRCMMQGLLHPAQCHSLC